MALGFLMLSVAALCFGAFHNLRSSQSLLKAFDAQCKLIALQQGQIDQLRGDLERSRTAIVAQHHLLQAVAAEVMAWSQSRTAVQRAAASKAARDGG